MTARSTHDGKRTWPAAPWWASVGGIAAVVALAIGVGAWWFPQSPNGDPATVASAGGAAPGSDSVPIPSAAVSSPGANSMRASQEAPAANAEKVSNCQRHHKMSRQHQVDGAGTGTVSFKTCTWPPSSITDADGYSEILVNEDEGPGDSAASGVNLAHRITGPCQRFTLTYDYGHMGDSRHLKSFDAWPGSIMVVGYNGGEEWDGDQSTIPFYPSRDEVVVLTSGNYVISNAQCADTP
jgi:hypothetical protein